LRRHQGIAKNAGGASVDKRLDASSDRLFQQVERAGDVGVDKILPPMGSNVRFVQGCGMKDCLNSAHAAPHAGAVCNRADVRGKGRLQDVESNHLVSQFLQASHQGLPQVPCTTGNQNLHGGVIPFRWLRKASFHSRTVRSRIRRLTGMLGF